MLVPRRHRGSARVMSDQIFSRAPKFSHASCRSTSSPSAALMPCGAARAAVIPASRIARSVALRVRPIPTTSTCLLRMRRASVFTRWTRYAARFRQPALYLQTDQLSAARSNISLPAFHPVAIKARRHSRRSIFQKTQTVLQTSAKTTS